MVIRRIPDKIYKALGTQQVSSSERLVIVTGLRNYKSMPFAAGCHTSTGCREIALELVFPTPVLFPLLSWVHFLPFLMDFVFTEFCLKRVLTAL